MKVTISMARVGRKRDGERLVDRLGPFRQQLVERAAARTDAAAIVSDVWPCDPAAGAPALGGERRERKHGTREATNGHAPDRNTPRHGR